MPLFALSQFQIGVVLLVLPPPSMGLGEKKFGWVIAELPMSNEQFGMLEPPIAAAPPSSSTLVFPTKPKTESFICSVDDRLTPGSSRSSALDSDSLRPQTPPWALT